MVKRLLLALVVTVIALPSAWAHTALVSAAPEVGATVPAMPASITLTFNEDLMVLGSTKVNRISITNSDGGEIPGIKVSTEGAHLSAKIPTGNYSAGTYTVKYRITSADGHPVEGSYEFAVKTMSASNISKVKSDEVKGGREGSFTIIAGAIVILGLLAYAFIRRVKKA